MSPGGGAHYLGAVQPGGAGTRHYRLRAEPGRGSQQRPHVSGVLHAVEHENGAGIAEVLGARVGSVEAALGHGDEALGGVHVREILQCVCIRFEHRARKPVEKRLHGRVVEGLGGDDDVDERSVRVEGRL